MARAKPPENPVIRAEGKKTEPLAAPMEQPHPVQPVLGSGWILTGTLWLVFFVVLVLYEGYGLLKGILGF
ncbi:MAG: hypothetical protein SNJ82_08865 [Gemmataceae bacterium]